jgi:hypothetical protein
MAVIAVEGFFSWGAERYTVPHIVIVKSVRLSFQHAQFSP